jgi:hypothetical protein
MATSATSIGLSSSYDDFPFESDMKPYVVCWLRRQGLIIKQEFSLPWGVCDVVGMRFDPTNVQLRLSHGQIHAIGSITRLQILARIPDVSSGTSVSMRSLKKQLFYHLRSHALAKELDVLQQRKFVCSPRRGFFQKLNGWAPLHSQIAAVELKLARISDALKQAAANRAFATHSYVALPRPLAIRLARSPRAGLLAQYGIGLLAVSNRGCREVIPASHKPEVVREVIQSHVVERFWRTRGS